jgi:hypothetical protein
VSIHHLSKDAHRQRSRESMTYPSRLLSSFRIPFYSQISRKSLGVYSDGGFRYGTDDGDECVVTGAFSFFKFASDTTYADQVNVAYVFALSMRIAGGTNTGSQTNFACEELSRIFVACRNRIHDNAASLAVAQQIALQAGQGSTPAQPGTKRLAS